MILETLVDRLLGHCSVLEGAVLVNAAKISVMGFIIVTPRNSEKIVNCSRN
jgi:hypothetical protein